MGDQRDGAGKRPYRTYSDEDRGACLAALAANGGDVARTAKQCGVPQRTLRAWAAVTSPTGAHAEASAMLCQRKKLDLAAKFDRIAHKACGVVYRKLGKLDARSASIVAGIAVDKKQLLRGLPTDISSAVDGRLARLTDDQLDQIERWLAEAQQRERQLSESAPGVSLGTAGLAPVADVAQQAQAEGRNSHTEAQD